jgi:hypothetical protein
MLLKEFLMHGEFRSAPHKTGVHWNSLPVAGSATTTFTASALIRQLAVDSEGKIHAACYKGVRVYRSDGRGMAPPGRFPR